MNEVLVATLKVYERNGAAWAAEYFEMAHTIIADKILSEKAGPAGLHTIYG